VGPVGRPGAPAARPRDPAPPRRGAYRQAAAGPGPGRRPGRAERPIGGRPPALGALRLGP